MSWSDAQLSFEELSKAEPKKGGHIRAKLNRISSKVFPKKEVKVAPATLKTVKGAPAAVDSVGSVTPRSPEVEKRELKAFETESKKTAPKVVAKPKREITKWTTAKRTMPKPAPTAVPKPPARSKGKWVFVPRKQRTHLN